MNHVRKRFEVEIDSGKVEILRGKSEILLKGFDDDSLDWVYIDTTHSYQQTKKEFELSEQKVKNEGVIAGHDYCRGNVNKALPYGVVRAVNEFCLNKGWEMRYLTHEPNRALSFALKKI